MYTLIYFTHLSLYIMSEMLITHIYIFYIIYIIYKYHTYLYYNIYIYYNIS